MEQEEVKINARVFVDHLDEERPNISLECNNAGRLRERQAHTTGILRTWVAGQVGTSIWVQMDNNGHLVPYNLTELALVKDCICAAMDAKPNIQYPQGWSCDAHGFVRKNMAYPAVYHQQQLDGRIRQVPAPTVAAIETVSPDRVTEHPDNRRG